MDTLILYGGGQNMAYSWKVLANDWSTLSDTDKEALFIGTNYNKHTVAELQ